MLAITIFSSIVGDMLPITDTTPLIGNQTHQSQVLSVLLLARNVLQLHHVHGQLQLHHHHPHPQLPPPPGRHPRDARLGGHGVPPVAALAPPHVQVGAGPAGACHVNRLFVFRKYVVC